VPPLKEGDNVPRLVLLLDEGDNVPRPVPYPLPIWSSITTPPLLPLLFLLQLLVSKILHLKGVLSVVTSNEKPTATILGRPLCYPKPPLSPLSKPLPLPKPPLLSKPPLQSKPLLLRRTRSIWGRRTRRSIRRRRRSMRMRTRSMRMRTRRRKK
jgi:hypothetical protein